MYFINQYHKENYEGAMAHYAESAKLPLNFEKEWQAVMEREERCRRMEQDEEACRQTKR